MIRVAVADDHPLIRRGVDQLLAGVPDIVLVAEAGTGLETLAILRSGVCDVLLLDIVMPERGGLDILPQIRSLAPDTAVIVLTVHPEEQYARRALRGGADGYVTKDSLPEVIVEAIRTVAAGDKYITRALASQLAEELAGERPAAPLDALSDREYEVMQRLAEGHTVSEIAELLSISVKTVSTYRRRILKKLRLSTTADIIRFAIVHRVIDLPEGSPFDPGV